MQAVYTVQLDRVIGRHDVGRLVDPCLVRDTRRVIPNS